MSPLGGKTKEDTAGPIDPAPVFLDARSEFAARFLAGEGLEIGALHQPLATPPQAQVRYVDRLSVDDLRSEYPELADWDLTEVDVIDNGELLETVAGGIAGLHRRQPLPRALRGPDPHDRHPPGQIEARRRALLRGARQALHVRPPAFG